MASLAERRAQTTTSPERQRPRALQTMTRIAGQHLLAEQKKLLDELADVMANAARPVDEDGEQTGPPRKASERARPARADEIREEISELHRRLAEYQDEVTFEGALTGGEWHLWKDAHPARKDDTSDRVLASGFCNATALFAELGKYVTEVNGEPVAPGDWDSWLAEEYVYADRREAIRTVVGLYEMQVDRAPKSRSDVSSTESSATD